MSPTNNKNSVKNNPTPTDESFSQAASLAVLAGLITTLGDGLATVAAILAIQEAQQQTNNDNSNNNSTNNAEIQSMQAQINALTKEVKQIRKMLHN